MADYTDINLCLGRLPILALDSSKDKPPVRDTIRELITEVSGEVDAAFGAAGVTAPTDVNSPLYKIVKFRVTGKVDFEVMATRGVAITKDQKPIWIDWGKQYDDMIKAILEGKFTAETLAESGEPWCFTMDDDENGTDETRQPAFKRGMQH
jgi:hypothetical protein